MTLRHPLTRLSTFFSTFDKKEHKKRGKIAPSGFSGLIPKVKTLSEVHTPIKFA
jgi:hypothetical protein